MLILLRNHQGVRVSKVSEPKSFSSFLLDNEDKYNKEDVNFLCSGTTDQEQLICRNACSSLTNDSSIVKMGINQIDYTARRSLVVD